MKIKTSDFKSGDWVQGSSNGRLHTGIFICDSLIASGLSLIAGWDEKTGTKYYLNMINAINVSEPETFPIDLPYYAMKHPDFNDEEVEGDKTSEFISGDWVEGYNSGNCIRGIYIHTFNPDSGLDLIASWSDRGKSIIKFYIGVRGTKEVVKDVGAPAGLPEFAKAHPKYEKLLYDIAFPDTEDVSKPGDWIEGTYAGETRQGIYIRSYDSGKLHLIASWDSVGFHKVKRYLHVSTMKSVPKNYNAPGDLMDFARNHAAFEKIKEEKGNDMASKGFVKCISGTCTGQWNINMRNNCPICDTIYIGKKKRKKIQQTRNSRWSKWAGRGAQNRVIIEYVKDEAWEAEVDCVEACSKAPEVIDIWVTPQAKTKIDAMMEKFPRIEWLAYLIGEEFTVTDIYVPKQKVTSVSVTDIDCPEYNDLDVIGVIHSHHGMGNGFSGTDDEWINRNHNISLCIAKSGVAGQVRWKTPCGSIKIVKAVTKLKIEFDFEKEDFLKAVDENVSETTYTYSYGYSGHVNQRNVGIPKHNTSNVTQCQKSYGAGVAVTDEDDNIWDTDNEETTDGDPKELDFTEEQTLADELEHLENADIDGVAVGDGL